MKERVCAMEQQQANHELLLGPCDGLTVQGPRSCMQQHPVGGWVMGCGMAWHGMACIPVHGGVVLVVSHTQCMNALVDTIAISIELEAT